MCNHPDEPPPTTMAPAALFAVPVMARAQDAISAPAQKTIGVPASSAMIPSLAVINSRGATLEGNNPNDD
jgi:hypothetical protein